jgi:hypothetical protein
LAGSLVPKDIDAATRKAKKEGRFVPLADVPDVIWKNLPSQVEGGRDTRLRQGPEHPVHSADIDEKRPSDGRRCVNCRSAIAPTSR